MPIRFPTAVAVHGSVTSARQEAAVNQSSRGPIMILIREPVAARVTAWSTVGYVVGGAPTGSRTPSARTFGPSCAIVSVDREPSTAGTAIPPRAAR